MIQTRRLVALAIVVCVVVLFCIGIRHWLSNDSSQSSSVASEPQTEQPPVADTAATDTNALPDDYILHRNGRSAWFKPFAENCRKNLTALRTLSDERDFLQQSDVLGPIVSASSNVLEASAANFELLSNSAPGKLQNAFSQSYMEISQANLIHVCTHISQIENLLATISDTSRSTLTQDATGFNSETNSNLTRVSSDLASSDDTPMANEDCKTSSAAIRDRVAEVRGLEKRSQTLLESNSDVTAAWLLAAHASFLTEIANADEVCLRSWSQSHATGQPGEP